MGCRRVRIWAACEGWARNKRDISLPHMDTQNQGWKEKLRPKHRIYPINIKTKMSETKIFDQAFSLIEINSIILVIILS